MNKKENLADLFIMIVVGIFSILDTRTNYFPI